MDELVGKDLFNLVEAILRKNVPPWPWPHLHIDFYGPLAIREPVVFGGISGAVNTAWAITQTRKVLHELR